jgi:hypothetical protein
MILVYDAYLEIILRLSGLVLVLRTFIRYSSESVLCRVPALVWSSENLKNN